MTIDKVLDKVRRNKGGYDVDEETLLSYISTVESMILTEIVCGREGDSAFIEEHGDGLDQETDRSRALFAPAPYDNIYAQYCATQIDLLSEDGDRYINDVAVFRDTFLDLKRFWWRGHRQKNRHRFF